MKLEWLLPELDKEVQAYREFREELSNAPPDNDAYARAEADLSVQLVRLKAELNKVLDAMEKANA